MTAGATSNHPGNGVRLIASVSAAHFFSHFYMLLLPPLFPLLKSNYNIGFAELGVAYSAFSIATALTQAPMGFVVDRFGARKILIAGLALMSIAFGLIGVFPGYWSLVGLMVLAGLANSVFHPADYALLSAGVPNHQMGRAFAIHTASGYFGSAVAPLSIIGLMGVIGVNGGLMVCGGLGLALAVWLWVNGAALVQADQDHHVARKEATGGVRGVRLLVSAPMLVALVFFIGIALTMGGIGNFSVSALHLQYGTPLALASTVLSAYLFASPAGVLFGGWLADRVRHHHWVAAISLMTVTVCVAGVAYGGPSLAVIGLLFAITGFASGVLAPSRDMMIRAMTPPGESGKVFGFVTSGYNLAGIVGPPAFGFVLDTLHPSMIFWAVVALALSTLLSVLATAWVSTNSQRASAAANAQ